MAEARVIRMDGGTGRRRAAPGARSVAAGADRASGERARRRRRTTPLLADLERATEPAASGLEEADQSARAPDPVARAGGAKAAAVETGAVESGPGSAGAFETGAVAADAVAAGAVAADAGEEGAAKPGTAKRGTAKARTAKPRSAKPVTAKPRGAGNGAAKARPARASARKISAVEVGGAEAAVTLRPAEAGPAGVGQADGSIVGGGAAALAEAMSQPAVQAVLALAAQTGERLVEALGSGLRPAQLEAKAAELLDFVARRLTGQFEVDEFGFDPELTDTVMLSLMRPLYRRWFRVEVRGIENIPDTGGALLVSNHSGTIPLDSLMTSVAVHDEHPLHRHLRPLAADLVFQTPFLANMARRTGSTLATNPDAERLLASGELVGVWPEGFKGVGKPFTERYKLQRFGRGGFVSAALRTRTPIIPCSVVGAEEIYPIIGNVPTLARLFGLPYLPITPFFPWLGPLGLVPLPSKWLIEFGPPLPTDEYPSSAADDPMLVFDLTDQVRQNIQQTLYSLLVQRRSVFF